MAKRTAGWIAGFTLVGGLASLSAMADGPLFGLYNPLGVYVGAGVGSSNINQIQHDPIDLDYYHMHGEPLGWNAVVGVRPIPFLGAEAEYIDFGKSHFGPGPVIQNNGTTGANEFLGSQAHDRAAAIYAVGYLPLPIPWLEPFAKLGWAQIWERDSTTGIYNDVSANISQSYNHEGTAYGGGLQFHVSQLAIRAQYERISASERYGWNDPALVSLGLNWTF